MASSSNVAAAGSSSSLTALAAPDVAEAKDEAPPRLILRLRPRRRITFTADTIDNENMNKKSSKRCCIYHKRRDFGESSSESEESDCEDCGPGKDHDDAKDAKDDAAAAAAPGMGWAKKKPPIARKKVPDYQRFHA